MHVQQQVDRSGQEARGWIEIEKDNIIGMYCCTGNRSVKSHVVRRVHVCELTSLQPSMQMIKAAHQENKVLFEF